LNCLSGFSKLSFDALNVIFLFWKFKFIYLATNIDLDCGTGSVVKAFCNRTFFSFCGDIILRLVDLTREPPTADGLLISSSLGEDKGTDRSPFGLYGLLT
jgi:hypothetical protein